MQQRTQENLTSKAALILGILAVIGIFTGIPGVIFGILAMVMAGNYKKQYGIRSNYAQIGFYCGLISVILAAINTIQIILSIFHFIHYSGLLYRYFPQIQEFFTNLFS